MKEEANIPNNTTMTNEDEYYEVKPLEFYQKPINLKKRYPALNRRQWQRRKDFSSRLLPSSMILRRSWLPQKGYRIDLNQHEVHYATLLDDIEARKTQSRLKPLLEESSSEGSDYLLDTETALSSSSDITDEKLDLFKEGAFDPAVFASTPTIDQNHIDGINTSKAGLRGTGCDARLDLLWWVRSGVPPAPKKSSKVIHRQDVVELNLLKTCSELVAKQKKKPLVPAFVVLDDQQSQDDSTDTTSFLGDGYDSSKSSCGENSTGNKQLQEGRQKVTSKQGGKIMLSPVAARRRAKQKFSSLSSPISNTTIGTVPLTPLREACSWEEMTMDDDNDSSLVVIDFQWVVRKSPTSEIHGVYTGPVMQMDEQTIVPHGPHGIMLFESGDKYEGPFENGDMHTTTEKAGVYSTPSQSVYTGAFWHNLRHGEGEMNLRNKFVYTGDFEFDKPHGYGVLVSTADNDDEDVKFQGEWRNGKPQLDNNDDLSSTFKPEMWSDDAAMFIMTRESTALQKERELAYTLKRQQVFEAQSQAVAAELIQRQKVKAIVAEAETLRRKLLLKNIHQNDEQSILANELISTCYIYEDGDHDYASSSGDWTSAIETLTTSSPGGNEGEEKQSVECSETRTTTSSSSSNNNGSKTMQPSSDLFRELDGKDLSTQLRLLVEQIEALEVLKYELFVILSNLNTGISSLTCENESIQRKIDALARCFRNLILEEKRTASNNNINKGGVQL